MRTALDTTQQATYCEYRISVTSMWRSKPSFERSRQICTASFFTLRGSFYWISCSSVIRRGNIACTNALNWKKLLEIDVAEVQSVARWQSSWISSRRLQQVTLSPFHQPALKMSTRVTKKQMASWSNFANNNNSIVRRYRGAGGIRLT